jgi:hypothetical protein
MRTMAQKPKATQQTTSAKSAIPGRAHSGHGSALHSILHLQRTIGNQAVQRLLEAHAAAVEVNSTTTDIARSGHDFSRIPISAEVPMKAQTTLTADTPGDVYEQEADRIADQVMATPAYTAVSSVPLATRHFSGQPNGQGDVASASVNQVLASPRRPLEPRLRQDMEHASVTTFQGCGCIPMRRRRSRRG